MNYITAIPEDIILYILLPKLDAISFRELILSYPSLKKLNYRKYILQNYSDLKEFRVLNYKTYNILLSTYMIKEMIKNVHLNISNVRTEYYSLNINTINLKNIYQYKDLYIRINSQIKTGSETPILSNIIYLNNLSNLHIESYEMLNFNIEIIGGMNNLKRLYIDCSNTIISGSIQNMERVEYINITASVQKSFLDKINTLINLKTLIFGLCRNLEIPKFISGNIKLKSLQINHGIYTGLENIYMIKSLHHLLLNNMMLIYSNIPMISNLLNLTSLKLNENSLFYIPTELYYLTNLKKLYINFNKLGSIDDNISKLINLRTLDISNNIINHISNDIKGLVNLDKLFAHANLLTNITSICNLISLEKLYIGNNKITYIDGGISKLTNLRILYLHTNIIKELPIELSYLNRLECLNLSANQISDIPKDILELPNLKIISLYSNPINKELLLRLGYTNIRFF
jgi:hypothetical protein